MKDKCDFAHELVFPSRIFLYLGTGSPIPRLKIDRIAKGETFCLPTGRWEWRQMKKVLCKPAQEDLSGMVFGHIWDVFRATEDIPAQIFSERPWQNSFSRIGEALTNEGLQRD